MKSAFALLAAIAPLAHAAVSGFDISNYQTNVNFAGAYASGARFVIIKVSTSDIHGCLLFPASCLTLLFVCYQLYHKLSDSS